MIEDLLCLKIDQACYSTLAVVLKSINPDISQRVKSLQTLISSLDTSIKGAFHKPGDNDVYMGVYISDLYYEHTRSVRITLEEVHKDGTRGQKFFLTIYGINAEEWSRNGAIKDMKSSKVLILLQNVPLQIKTNNEVHFYLVEAKKLNSSLWVKSFDNALKNTTEKYVYKSLAEAAGEVAYRCNLYAVVFSIAKEPATVKKGKAHGMAVLIDQSCYEGTTKKCEFCLHIFTSSLEKYPVLSRGDIVRLHRANADTRPSDGRVDFRIFSERDIVVFPCDDRAEPRFLGGHFSFLEEDIAKIQSLRQWSPLERPRTAAPVNELKLITLSEIKVNELFNLPCRLVQFFDEDVGIALWVEDGTRCPLYTVTNMQPFDSQATQDVCSDCARICVRCSKPLLGDLFLEKDMLLYLRQVEPTSENVGIDDGVVVVQFEVKGGVEKLPLHTRYHKSLVQRLEKSQPSSKRKELEQEAKIVERVVAEKDVEKDVTEKSEEILATPVDVPEPLKRLLISNDSEVVDSPPPSTQRRPTVLNHRLGSPVRSTAFTEAAPPAVQPNEKESDEAPCTASPQRPANDENFKTPAPVSEIVREVTVSGVTAVSPRRSPRNLKPVTPPKTLKAVKEPEQPESQSRYSLRSKNVQPSGQTETVEQTKKAPKTKDKRKSLATSSRYPLKTQQRLQWQTFESEDKIEEPEPSQAAPVPEPEAQLPEKDVIQSSSESTERAMKEMEIPEDHVRSQPNVLDISPRRVMREATRLSFLLGDDDDVDIPATQFVRPPQTRTQEIAELEEATFSQVVASTQKVNLRERSPSPEIPNGQRIFNQSSSEDSGEKDVIPGTQRLEINSPSSTPSPNPAFKVANEVLDIQTIAESQFAEENDENQHYVEPSPAKPQCQTKGKGIRKERAVSTAESNDELENDAESPPRASQKRVVIQEMNDFSQQIMESPPESHTRVRCTIRRSQMSSQRDIEICPSQYRQTRSSSQPLVGILKTKSAYPRDSQEASQASSSRKREASPEWRLPPKKNRKTHERTSSDECVLLPVDERRESDAESVIMLDPASQFDMEKIYQTVEEAALRYSKVERLEDIDSFMPGEHFRIKTRIKDLLPKNHSQDGQSSLENLLVGICPECKHMWEHRAFKSSFSQKAQRSRLPPREAVPPPEDEEAVGVINYLCSEEAHDENMRLLAESEHPDIASYDYDENIFMDQSYVFVCPMCKSHGIPDTLCQLKPSFFFWLHLTEKSKNGWKGCLHVMASGTHAEYFLGTKADHVLRSTEVWEKTEARIAKLIKHEEPITLVICQSPDSLDEFYLEHTYVVYSEKHVLPWFSS